MVWPASFSCWKTCSVWLRSLPFHMIRVLSTSKKTLSERPPPMGIPAVGVPFCSAVGRSSVGSVTWSPLSQGARASSLGAFALLGLGEEVTDELVERLGLLEVDRVACARDLDILRVGEFVGQCLDQRRRRDAVVAPHEAERGHGAVLHLIEGGRARGGYRRALARWVQPLDLAVQEGHGRVRFLVVLGERAMHEGCRDSGLHRAGALLLLGPVEEAPRVGHHQCAHAIRVAHGVTERGAAAHRLRDDRALLHAEVLDERLEVIDEARDALAGGVEGATEAAVVDGDAAVGSAEGRHLLPPRHVVATRAVVPEDDGLAVLVRRVAVL